VNDAPHRVLIRPFGRASAARRAASWGLWLAVAALLLAQALVVQHRYAHAWGPAHAHGLGQAVAQAVAQAAAAHAQSDCAEHGSDHTHAHGAAPLDHAGSDEVAFGHGSHEHERCQAFDHAALADALLPELAAAALASPRADVLPGWTARSAQPRGPSPQVRGPPLT
jgi:hypothetical protein